MTGNGEHKHKSVEAGGGGGEEVGGDGRGEGLRGDLQVVCVLSRILVTHTHTKLFCFMFNHCRTYVFKKENHTLGNALRSMLLTNPQVLKN